MKSLFNGKYMTWGRAIAIALISGLLAGLFAQIGYMNGTSFTDFFRAWEWWVFFGLLLAARNDNFAISFFQTIVFFLVGLTLMLLVQWPVLGKGGFIAYVRGHIILFLIVTIAGGILAYLATLKGPVFAVLLALFETVTACCLVNHIFEFRAVSPHHLISIVFCVLSIFASVWGIGKDRAYRAVALSIPIVLALVYAFVRYRFGFVFLLPRF